MRRLYVMLATTALAVVGLGASVGASAPPDSPPAPAAVPDDSTSLVGSWLLTDVTDPANPDTFVASFSSDGIYTQLDPDGNGGIGVWAPSEPATTANMTFMEQSYNDDGSPGGYVVRAAIESGTRRHDSDGDLHVGSSR